MRRACAGDPRAYVLASCLLLSVGCVSRTHGHAIQVKSGSSTEERISRARSLVTQERLSRLRTQIKARLPAVSDAQLAGLGLRWKVAHMRSFGGKEPITTVTVIVEIRYASGFDPKPIIEAAAAILEPEVNAPAQGGA